MFFPSVDCLGAYVDDFGVGETVVGGFSRLGQGAYFNLAAVTGAANRKFLNFEKLQFAFSVIFLQVLLYTHKHSLRGSLCHETSVWVVAKSFVITRNKPRVWVIFV